MKKILYLLFLVLTLIGCTIQLDDISTTTTNNISTTDTNTSSTETSSSVDESTTTNETASTDSTTTTIEQTTTTTAVQTTIETTTIETTTTTNTSSLIDEDGRFTSRDQVALYIYVYGRLPKNYITKDDAYDLGWNGGDNLWKITDRMSIGGDQFYNKEGLLPSGKYYTECDIDYNGGKTRGTRRIVFSSNGLIFYTDDHYDSFSLFSLEVINNESIIRWDPNYRK